MSSSVQARLDAESLRTLKRLTRQLGLTPSQVVREGLRLLGACRLASGSRQIIGLGKFESGIADLGSNKDRLTGFGR